LSGSTDVLEALGVNINLTPENVKKMIEEIGIAFCMLLYFFLLCVKFYLLKQNLELKQLSTQLLDH
jgi:anthranilate phosphoribosyltransferase